jgi:hypothetical protein
MEEFKLIDNYKYPYYVSNTGKIKNSKGIILTPRFDKDNYLRVRLINKQGKRSQQMVHRLVAVAFIPGDFTLTVNHKDGIKVNNNKDNLEWLSRSDNNKHAYKTGLKNNTGENHPKSHFKEQDILKIRELYSTGNYSQTKLAKLFRVGQPRIWEIINNITWKNI